MQPARLLRWLPFENECDISSREKLESVKNDEIHLHPANLWQSYDPDFWKLRHQRGNEGRSGDMSSLPALELVLVCSASISRYSELSLGFQQAELLASYQLTKENQ